MNEQDANGFLKRAIETYEAKRAAMLAAKADLERVTKASNEATRAWLLARDECADAWRALWEDYRQNGGTAE